MLWLYSATLFLSAFLLFLIQPMVGKMILPALGGTPAVWNTCMVFFQAALLAGYTVAHGGVRALGVRKQSILHVALLALPLLPMLQLLPLTIQLKEIPTSADNPAFWLLGQLAICVGLPFLVVATNAPVLQMWFSQTGHASARDPYFLYGASNAGSLLALLGYPLVVERYFSLSAQRLLWSWGFRALAVLVLFCALALRGRRTVPVGAVIEADVAAAPTAEPISLVRRLRWIALAFVPSSLTLGATTYVTTDIAPIPLLWVLPLALYITSFVIVFARRPVVSHAKALQFFPIVIVLVAFLPTENIAVLGMFPVIAHFLLVFFVAMVCHGELVADRPSIGHLTHFYLLMSVGGVLGGIFNGLVSPSVFHSLMEYPIAMVLACLVLSHAREYRMGPLVKSCGIAVLAFAAVLLLRWFQYRAHLGHAILISIGVPALLCIGVLRLWRRWSEFGLTLAACMVAIAIGERFGLEKVLYKDRNFYGVKSVSVDDGERAHFFYSGTTLHGVQLLEKAASRKPLSYYHQAGPIGDVMRDRKGRNLARRVAVVGLGVGGIAAYREAGEFYVFYEIDPDVARIATTPEYFTYMSLCGDACSIILGDGRLEMAKAKSAEYDVIVLDAFASDAVPTHLLTAEALGLYLDKLSSEGLMVFNVTNRYLHLERVLANLAKKLNLAMAMRNDLYIDRSDPSSVGRNSSFYVVLARSELDLEGLRRVGWTGPPKESDDFGTWTDDHTNIFSALDW